MKHTSIRLSDDHQRRIAETGESPTVVIRRALDLYFGISSPETNRILELMDQVMNEHIRQYHTEDKH